MPFVTDNKPMPIFSGLGITSRRYRGDVSASKIVALTGAGISGVGGNTRFPFPWYYRPVQTYDVSQPMAVFELVLKGESLSDHSEMWQRVGKDNDTNNDASTYPEPTDANVLMFLMKTVIRNAEEGSSRSV